MCMGTLSIHFTIKIIINSGIFLTHQNIQVYSQQDETQKSNCNGEENEKFHKRNHHKCFSINKLITY